MSHNAEKLRRLQGLEDQAVEIEKVILNGCYAMASDTASALDNIASALVLHARIRLFELSCKVREGEL